MKEWTSSERVLTNLRQRVGRDLCRRHFSDGERVIERRRKRQHGATEACKYACRTDGFNEQDVKILNGRSNVDRTVALPSVPQRVPLLGVSIIAQHAIQVADPADASG